MQSIKADTPKQFAMDQSDYASLAECLSVLGEIARGDLTANRMKSRAINTLQNHQARKAAAANAEAA